MRTIPWIVTVAMAASLAGMAACGGSNDDPATPTDGPGGGGGIPASLTTVTISDNKFAPIGLQVPVGTNVTWKWTGSGRHSVKGSFDGQDISSPTLSGSGAFLYAFQKSGTFEYECGIHGSAMKGTITIQ